MCSVCTPRLWDCEVGCGCIHAGRGHSSQSRTNTRLLARVAEDADGLSRACIQFPNYGSRVGASFIATEADWHQYRPASVLEALGRDPLAPSRQERKRHPYGLPKWDGPDIEGPPSCARRASFLCAKGLPPAGMHVICIYQNLSQTLREYIFGCSQC